MPPPRMISVYSLLLISLAILCCAPAATDNPILSLEPAEQLKTDRYLPYAPEDGYTVQINPPGFNWTAHDRAAAYKFLLFKAAEPGRALKELDNLSSTAAVLHSPLDPGEYNWCVAYIDSAGKPFGRSRVRKFTVEPGLTELPMPDISLIADKLEGVRPRISLLPGEVARIKEAIDSGRLPAWEVCLALADAALAEPLYPEPAPYKDGKFEVNEWRRIYTPGKVGTAHMVRLGLAFYLTGEPKYLQGARTWLVHLAKWDPNGITSYNLPLPDGSSGNDEAGMPLLWRMSMVYDWLAGELTSEEKSIVLGSLRERGNQLHNYYLESDFITNPWSNHAGRALAYFGLAGISCLNDLPEAADWLEYTLRAYLTSYPSWGGDEGGWGQGLSYWCSYIIRHTYFLDALPLATGVDLYKKPFYRNNGYFPVYFHPPYAKRGAFGDGGYRAPNVNEKLLLQKYALATGNPIFLWHAGQINTGDQTAQGIKNDAGEINWRPWAMEDVAEVLGAAPAGLKSKPPTGLPGSRFLKDIGWVAAHSELGSAENDVWVMFKSSRYGSLSHSHADQNSFILNAYGEPLLIDSGYYPWYGSPHHCLWTRRTRAHNAVLVNGRGQGNFSMAARGKIEQYSHTGKLTYLRAEAGSAYNVPLSDGTLELWKEHLGGPTPSMEPKVLAARRSLAFSADKQHPWLAVHDYLETDSPASFDYLLHSQEKMELEQDAATVLVKQGAARVKVFILSDNDLVFSQDDEFSPPPGNRYEGARNQWHFKARTENEANRVKFLALYVPYREGEDPPSVEPVAAGAARGFKVAGEQVLAWWGDSETGDLAGYGAGRLFLELKEAEGLKRHAKD